MRFGWWSLLCFLTLGIVLESLHGFKVGWYLDVANETRRFLWTLAHAHGVLLSLVNLAFAVTLPHLAADTVRLARLASPCLMGATLFLPGGFLLGGVVIHGGDPGLGILLVPVGALLLFVSVLLTARARHSVEETGIFPRTGSGSRRTAQAGRPSKKTLSRLMGRPAWRMLRNSRRRTPETDSWISCSSMSLLQNSAVGRLPGMATEGTKNTNCALCAFCAYCGETAFSPSRTRY